MNEYSLLKVSKEVDEALLDKKPVVALESTLITHGLPYPQNLETGLEVEQVIKDLGVQPATVAVMGGKLTVGLSQAELETLARSGTSLLKVSRRDLPYALAARKDGGTTVASTMIAASLCGIKVFATGGIGGVHRGGQESMDISADLKELAQTDVAVVCAGAKAILDIGRTLEVLETFGVPVVGFKTDAFPAFYSQESGFKADFRVDTAEEAAKLLSAKWGLGLKGGVLFCRPPPSKYAMPRAEVKEAIQQALKKAGSQKIAGKKVTPFLLQEVAELTGGKSLQANLALIKENARVAAEIATALAVI